MSLCPASHPFDQAVSRAKRPDSVRGYDGDLPSCRCPIRLHLDDEARAAAMPHAVEVGDAVAIDLPPWGFRCFAVE